MRRFSIAVCSRLLRPSGHLRAFLLLAVLPTVLPAAQDQPVVNGDAAAVASPGPSAPPAVVSEVAAKPSFCSARTVLWADRTAVIPLRTTQAVGMDHTYALNTSDASVLEILRPPTVLGGEIRGYLRVRPLRPGRVRLTVGDEATLDVEVRPDPASAAFAQTDAENPRPRLVSPLPEAAVWGEFAVGVDVFDDRAFASAPPPQVQLRLPNGQNLDPAYCTGLEAGPARHYQFLVDADTLPVGTAKLVAVSTPAGCTDLDRLAKKPASLLESEPLPLRILRPGAGALTAGSCADPAVLGATGDLLAPGRMPRFGSRQPNVRKDPAAASGEMVACPSTDPAWCLPFRAREAGEYQLIVRARGDLGGGAWPTVAVYLNNTEAPLGATRLTGPRYHRTPVSTPFHLDAGWQTLTVRFTNDFAVAKEDRNLFLDRYELVRVGDHPPMALAAPTTSNSPVGTHPPVALGATVSAATANAAVVLASPPAETVAPSAEYRPAILYPANGASVFGADAVVARVLGGNPALPPAWVDVLLDGEPQNVRAVSPPPTSAILCPLLLRQVAPGAHRLSVRVADAVGHTADSPAQILNVLPAAPSARGPYDRAVFLLDRLAFGPDPREMAAVLTLGETVWLNNRLNAGFDSPVDQALLRQASTKYPRIDDDNQGVARALTQWIGTDNPVRARFTAWAENHFNTWVEKTRAAPKWHEHLDFCRLGVAPFADLLGVSAHSPAMLVYLDQRESYAGKINENYAREIMELHTLGVHGGYAQADVTALAGVLNGWTLATEGALAQPDAALGLAYNTNNEYGQGNVFRFVPSLNDGKPRRVLGLEFPAAPDPAARLDRVHLALEMLASHPGTADHICRQLAEHYVSVPAPDLLVQTLSRTFLETGGDLRAVLRTLAGSNAFWNAPPRLATPFDYGLRMARLCRASLVELGANLDQPPKADQIGRFMKMSGMGLFDRVTPDGYPQNSASYIDSNALLQRWHFMEGNLDALNRLVPNPWRQPPAPAKTVATTNPVPMLLPIANDTATAAAPNPSAEAVAQRFLDLTAIRLTGRLLSPASNQAAREILADATPDQMKQTILFVSLLPETSLR